MKELIDALLNDENGISEKAYNALVELLLNIADGNNTADAIEGGEMLDYVRQADATDGRFYFPAE